MERRKSITEIPAFGGLKKQTIVVCGERAWNLWNRYILFKSLKALLEIRNRSSPCLHEAVWVVYLVKFFSHDALPGEQRPARWHPEDPIFVKLTVIKVFFRRLVQFGRSHHRPWPSPSDLKTVSFFDSSLVFELTDKKLERVLVLRDDPAIGCCDEAVRIAGQVESSVVKRAISLGDKPIW